MRGVGITPAVTELLPAWSVSVAAWLTVLGDPIVVLVVAALLYWFGDRVDLLSQVDGLRVFLVTVTVLAVVTALKQFFALPRPPSPTIAYTAEGYGFPSGHTTAATGFYGVLALLIDRWSQRQRTAIAVGVIGLVGSTRIVLGVHYLVDVLAGLITGVAVLAVVLAVTRERVWPGFVVGVLGGVVAAVVTGLHPAAVMSEDAAIALGGTVGAAVVWFSVVRTGADLETPGIPLATVTAAAAGLPLAWVLVSEVGLGVTVAVAGVAGAAVVGVPAVRRSRDTGRVPTD